MSAEWTGRHSAVHLADCSAEEKQSHRNAYTDEEIILLKESKFWDYSSSRHLLLFLIIFGNAWRKTASFECLSLAVLTTQWHSTALGVSSWMRSSGICIKPAMTFSCHHFLQFELSSLRHPLFIFSPWLKEEYMSWVWSGPKERLKRSSHCVSAVDIYLKEWTLAYPRHLHHDLLFKPYLLYQDPK